MYKNLFFDWQFNVVEIKTIFDFINMNLVLSMKTFE